MSSSSYSAPTTLDIRLNELVITFFYWTFLDVFDFFLERFHVYGAE